MLATPIMACMQESFGSAIYMGSKENVSGKDSVKRLSEDSGKSDNVNSICMSEHVFLNLTKDSTRVGLELKLHTVIHLL